MSDPVLIGEQYWRKASQGRHRTGELVLDGAADGGSTAEPLLRGLQTPRSSGIGFILSASLCDDPPRLLLFTIQGPA